MAKKSPKNVAVAAPVAAVDATTEALNTTQETTVTETAAETVAPAVAADKPVKVSKRATAIAIMAENHDKPMAEVCDLIAAANGLTSAAARSYYKWIVENKMAPGTVVKLERTPGEKGERPVKAESKRAKAIAVMVANETKPMGEVLPLIAEACQVPLGNARSYYKWLVENKMAPGIVVKQAKEPKEPKVKATAAKKEEKPVLAPAELAKVKAANLAKMKALAAKKKGGAEPVGEDHPETLSADEVRELV